MWPDNQIIDLFNIKHPIIQAPMAGVCGVEMVLAVCAAGGLGSLPCATMDPISLRKKLTELRNKTSAPINVNFFAHNKPENNQDLDSTWCQQLSPYFEELQLPTISELTEGPIQSFDEQKCAVLEDIAPEIVSFHFGLPKSDLVTRLKAIGSKIICSATTPREAKWLEENGCDAIIAQGYEAGGHRGMFLEKNIDTQMGTMALLPQIVDVVSLPIIAAGGIADGRGIAAAFALGASGVQLGTAYLFADEANLNQKYVETLKSDASSNTALTNIFSGNPARCIVNRVMQEIGPMADQMVPFPKGFSAIGSLRSAAEKNDSRDFSAHYSGQAASLGRSASAAQLTTTLALHAQNRLAELSK